MKLVLTNENTVAAIEVCADSEWTVTTMTMEQYISFTAESIQNMAATAAANTDSEENSYPMLGTEWVFGALVNTLSELRFDTDEVVLAHPMATDLVLSVVDFNDLVAKEMLVPFDDYS